MDSPEIRARISADIAKVRDAIVAEVATVQAIFLTGSFGRGEGGVRVSDGSITPVNDYDFQIVTSQPPDPDQVEMLSERLAKSIGIAWIHIDAVTPHGLKRRMFKKQYGYDFLQGHRLIHGSSACLSAIPAFRADQIPGSEAERLLYARLWCFAGPVSDPTFENPLVGQDEFFFHNQMSKAINACVEAVLILRGEYHELSQVRCERIDREPGDLAEHLDLIRWGARFKLHPDTAPLAPQQALYDRCRALYRQVLADMVRQNYGPSVGVWRARFEKHPAPGRFNPIFQLMRLRGVTPQTVGLYHLAMGTDPRSIQKAAESTRTQLSPGFNRLQQWQMIRDVTLSLPGGH